MTDELSLIPEFEYTEDYVWATVRTPFESGVVQKRARWQDPKRLFYLHWDNAYTSEKDTLLSFLYDLSGAAGEFLWQRPDPVLPPYNAGTVSPRAGGSYGSRTYYYAITWTTALGETTSSPVYSTAIAANYLFSIQIPRFKTNVTGVNVYLGTASNALKLQVALSGSRSTWTESASGISNGIIDGVAPPTTSTAYEKVRVAVMEDTIKVTKVSPVSYRIDVTFEELL